MKFDDDEKDKILDETDDSDISSIDEDENEAVNIPEIDESTISEDDLSEAASTIKSGYFDELNKYNVLTKEEEQELGAKIHEAHCSMVKYICITNIIKKNITDLRSQIIYFESLDDCSFIDIEKFEEEKKDTNFQLLEHILGLIDNFINAHEYFIKKNKKSIAKLEWSKIVGLDRVINAFNWIQLSKSFIIKVADDIREIISDASESYDIIEKNRAHKKKKDDFHKNKVNDAEEALGIPFKLSLDFLKELNSFSYQQNAAKNKMILSNVRLVAFAARYFRDKDLKYSDLLQFGNLGLLRSVLRFDFTKGNKFSTYAVWWINQFISRKQQTSKLFKVPSHLLDILYKFRRAKNVAQNSGLDLSDAEICYQEGLEYNTVKKALRESKSSGSLDRYIGTDNTAVTFEDVIKFKNDDAWNAYTDNDSLKTVACAFLKVSSETENRFRVRSLSTEDAKSLVYKKVPLEVRNKFNGVTNKCNKYMLLNNNKLGDIKMSSRNDIQEMSTIRKHMIPTSLPNDLDRNTSRVMNDRNLNQRRHKFLNGFKTWKSKA